MRISLLLFGFLFFISGLVNAQPLLDQVKNSDFLLEGNLAILTCEGKKSLVSVGTATVDTTKPSLVKQAMIIAKVNAQNQLSKFIHEAKIYVTETLENQLQVIDEIGKPSSRKQKQIYFEQIKETSEGALRNIVSVGSWSENDMYFYVIAIPLD